jgi:hypothetical protein
MKKTAMLFFSALIMTSCHNTASTKQDTHENSEYQEKLMRDGWTFEELSDSELGEEYGVTPIYGVQDNYFDITMGEGYNVAVKIVDAQTDKCIRYAVVPENSTTTITQIPQGRYYLKLAYGKDWMEFHADSLIIGKFTRNAFYERSRQVYDFGKKNSLQEVNYDLRINVCEETGMNNFETTPISEEEFLKE